MPPAAAAAASALWKSSTSSPSSDRWEHLRAQHADLQRRAGVASGDGIKLARLASLDASFIARDLPQKLQSNSNLTKDDLVQMVEWKLLRGKWRPALLGYAKAQTDAAVGAATAKALDALGGCNVSRPPPDAQTRAALDALCALRGVGPATASIVLCAATGGQVPYMGDEALEAAVGTRKYDASELLLLAGRLREKARELTKVGKKRVWTAEDVQRALHAAELEARMNGGAAAATTKTKTKATTTKKSEAEDGGGGTAATTTVPAAAAAAAAKRQRRR